MNPHNPDGLTPEQVGEGWRLLNEDEIPNRQTSWPKVCEAWLTSAEVWKDGYIGESVEVTYRTRLSRAELRKVRGLPGEKTGIAALAEMAQGSQHPLAFVDQQNQEIARLTALVGKMREALEGCERKLRFNPIAYTSDKEIAASQNALSLTPADMGEWVRKEELDQLIKDWADEDDAIKELAQAVGIQGDFTDGYFRDCVRVSEDFANEILKLRTKLAEVEKERDNKEEECKAWEESTRPAHNAMAELVFAKARIAELENVAAAAIPAVGTMLHEVYQNCTDEQIGLDEWWWPALLALAKKGA